MMNGTETYSEKGQAIRSGRIQIWIRIFVILGVAAGIAGISNDVFAQRSTRSSSSRNGNGKFPSDFWHEGKIVLVEGDTLKGLVKYDLQQDMIQYALTDKQTEAFSARKVLYCEIFDQSVRKYRQFFVLPYTTPSQYKAPVFFELLDEGKITLLARESLEYRAVGYSPYGYGTPYPSPYGYSNGRYANPMGAQQLVLVYKYFILDEKGDITEFNATKNNVLDLMGKRSEEVEKYAKANKLKFDDKNDLTRIIAYYNSLVGT